MDLVLRGIEMIFEHKRVIIKIAGCNCIIGVKKLFQGVELFLGKLERVFQIVLKNANLSEQENY